MHHNDKEKLQILGQKLLSSVYSEWLFRLALDAKYMRQLEPGPLVLSDTWHDIVLLACVMTRGT